MKQLDNSAHKFLLVAMNGSLDEIYFFFGLYFRNMDVSSLVFHLYDITRKVNIKSVPDHSKPTVLGPPSLKQAL